MQRFVTGSVLAVLLCAAVVGLHSDGFLVVLLAVAVGAAWELAPIVVGAGSRRSAVVLSFGVVATVVAWRWCRRSVDEVISPEALFAAGCGLVALAVLAGLIGRGSEKQRFYSVCLVAWGIPYLSLPIIAVDEVHRRDPRLVLVLLAIVALGDVAAYYVGSSIGRHRMAPRLSPKKSWEGSLGALSAAALVAVVWCRLDPEAVLWRAILGAMLVNAAAQLGDLTESLIKRAGGVKDSGTVLPGHGGILDRIDAALLAAPVFYLLLDLFLGAP